jgi:hypothetical protein
MRGYDTKPDAGFRAEEIDQACVGRAGAEIRTLRADLKRQGGGEVVGAGPAPRDEDIPNTPAILRLKRKSDEQAVGRHGTQPQENVTEARLCCRHGPVATIRFEAKDRGRHHASAAVAAS